MSLNTNETKEMCGTTDSLFQSSNTLNNAGIWSIIELASLPTAPLSAINGLSRLTTTSNGQALPIRKFLNRSITFKSNLNGRFKSNLEASQVPTQEVPYSLLPLVTFPAEKHWHKHNQNWPQSLRTTPDISNICKQNPGILSSLSY